MLTEICADYVALNIIVCRDDDLGDTLCKPVDQSYKTSIFRPDHKFAPDQLLKLQGPGPRCVEVSLAGMSIGADDPHVWTFEVEPGILIARF